MGKRTYDINVTPSCPACAAHEEAEGDRLMDSFRAIYLADRSVNLRELRIAYFEGYHKRGHAKTEEWAELDGELVDY